jgi:hypothetical protein
VSIQPRAVVESAEGIIQEADEIQSVIVFGVTLL